MKSVRRVAHIGTAQEFPENREQIHVDATKIAYLV
jgi:hypothetical protein